MRSHACPESRQHPRETGGKPLSPALGPTPCSLSLGKEPTLEVFQSSRLRLPPSEQTLVHGPKLGDDPPPQATPQRNSPSFGPARGPRWILCSPSLGEGFTPFCGRPLPRKSRLDITSCPLPGFPYSIKPGWQPKFSVSDCLLSLQIGPGLAGADLPDVSNFTFKI